MNKFKKSLKIGSLMGLAGYFILSVCSNLLDTGLHKYGNYVDLAAGSDTLSGIFLLAGLCIYGAVIELSRIKMLPKKALPLISGSGKR